jgi:hypothetical protein
MTPEALKHLASRLSRFEHKRCVEATLQVRRAIECSERFGQAEAEQALCHAIWAHLDAAIEGEDEEGPVETALDAMRAEMAGRVYMAGLALGWITRPSAAPAATPTLAELGI